MNCPRRIVQARKSVFLACVLLCLALAFPVFAKTDVDFDPNLDFSKFKTFAFIGGVENLMMLPVNPELINNRVHRAATREMTAKGLREVQPNQNPDLVVRYWASTSQQVNVATMGNWGPYGAYVGSYWGWMYDTVSASSSKEGSLLVDLIDPHSKTLAWRLYLTRKLSNSDKDWKKADEEFTRAFEGYPPSDKEKDAKRKERAAHPPKNDQP
jgi:hypothetical protein